MVLKSFLTDVSLTLGFSVFAATVAWLTYYCLGFGRVMLGAWCCVEVIFFAVQRWRYHDLNKVNKRTPSTHDIDARIHQFLSLHNFIDIKEFITGWFLNIPFTEIRRGNVADFIAYAYWYKPRTSLSIADQEAVMDYTRLIEQTWGVQFPEGYNESLQLMAHLWQPLRVLHKPLFVHLASEGSMLVTHLCLQGLGFTRYQCMGFTYWVKGLPEPSGVDEEPSSWLTRPSGRMTLLQGVIRDFRNLLPESLLPWGGAVSAAGGGPFDFMASLSLPQLQGLQEYKARLQATLQQLRSLPGSLPSFQDLSAMSADMQQSFTAGVRNATDRLPTIGPLPPAILERVNAARERLPALQLDLAQHLNAARAVLPTLPPLPVLSTNGMQQRFTAATTAARDVLHTLPSVPDMRSAAERQLVSARERLPSLPSLPDGVRQQLAAARDCLSPLERRIRAISTALADATSTIMQCAELDGFFIRMSPAGSASDAAPGARHPVDDMTATIERWIAAAGSTLEAAGTSLRGASAAAFSGISLPCYTDLVNSYSQLMGSSETVAQSSYFLRQSVESALLQRTASGLQSAAVEADAGSVSAADSLHDLAASQALDSTSLDAALGVAFGSFDAGPSAACRGGRHDAAQAVAARGAILRTIAQARQASLGAASSNTSFHSQAQSSLGAASWSTVDWHDVNGGGREPAAAADPNEASSRFKAHGLSPICFLHGVGFGVFPYLGFVWKLLTAFQKRPFILLEVRHVSLRLCMRALGVDDVVRALAEVLRRHEVMSCNFVGHSFGTFVIAHMRKLFPEMVASVLLCDPVCMLTCFPKLLYNFIYKGVSLDDMMKNPADAARFLAARDLIIAETFCRHFWWHTLMMWPDELPNPSVLVLSGKDDLVPSLLVTKMLQNAPKHVKVLYHPDLYHGHFLIDRPWQDTIVKAFKAAVDNKEESDKTA